MAGSAAEELQIRVEHRRQSPPRLLPRRHGPRETASPPIPDELLLDIFRRIPSPTDLVRTSAACITFRRLIADLSFLQQYRKLHAPPLLGLLGSTGKGFYPAEPPHPSASAASAVALAADFSFSFLPAPAHGWEVEDTRDGRVLLLDRPRIQHHTDWTRGIIAFWEIAVCDPLHRRYILVPPVLEDQVASVMEKPVWKNEAFLIPSDNDEETSFRVMLMGQGQTKLSAFVFSSNNGQWRAIPSMSWIDLLAGLLSSTYTAFFNCRTYSSGCFYWLSSPSFWIDGMKMLLFDTQRMKFSVAEPPPEAKSSRGIPMLEAQEGRHGMFVLESGPPNFILHYYIMQNNGGSASQWHKEKTISLSQGYCYKRSLSPGIAYELAGSVEERYLLLLQ